MAEFGGSPEHICGEDKIEIFLPMLLARFSLKAPKVCLVLPQKGETFLLWHV